MILQKIILKASTKLWCHLELLKLSFFKQAKMKLYNHNNSNSKAQCVPKIPLKIYKLSQCRKMKNKK